MRISLLIQRSSGKGALMRSLLALAIVLLAYTAGVITGIAATMRDTERAVLEVRQALERENEARLARERAEHEHG